MRNLKESRIFTSQKPIPSSARHTLVPMIVIGVLFFVFGFISWINAILIPYFKIVCELSIQQSMLVVFAFYISYFVMAFPSSYILGKTGYRNGIIVGLVTMAFGALIFLPAAWTRNYNTFLVGLFVQATGLTLLQTASNPYVTILGPIESAAKRMSIMGICNKVAGALAPLILLSFIVNSSDEIDNLQKQLPELPASEIYVVLDDLAKRLLMPYLFVAVILVLLALAIRLVNFPDIREQDLPEEQVRTVAPDARKSLLQYPHLLLGSLAVFCGVSVEVLAVDSIITYAEFTGMSFRSAKFFASYTLVIMIISYALGIFAIPRLIDQRRVLVLSAIAGLTLTILALATSGVVSVWCIALLGFGNALLWPSIWPLSLSGLGRWTKQGSALLIMGVVGGALTPLAYGIISDATDPQAGYWILCPLYVFILYFGLSGYRTGISKKRSDYAEVRDRM